jgi:hypothetical protein
VAVAVLLAVKQVRLPYLDLADLTVWKPDQDLAVEITFISDKPVFINDWEARC